MPIQRSRTKSKKRTLQEAIKQVKGRFSSKPPQPIGDCYQQTATHVALVKAAQSSDTSGCSKNIRKISKVLGVRGFLQKKPSAKKGVQAVLLPYWSTTSVTNLVNTLTAATHATTPIAISFLVKESRVSNVANPIGEENKGDTDNIKTILDSLTGDRKIDVIVHLSYHGPDHGPEERISGHELALGAQKIKKDLIIPYKSRSEITFFISPQLEDKWDKSEYLKRAREVLKVVAFKDDDDTKNTELLTNVNLWRNSIKDDHNHLNGKSPTTVDASVTVYNPEGAKEKVCLQARPAYETHSLSPPPGYHAWSNDGVFVYHKMYDGYYDPPRDTNPLFNEYTKSVCTSNSPGATTRKHISLSKFKSPHRLVLLWRPVYNLLEVTNWSKDATKTKKCYLPRNKSTAINYRDSLENPRFDDREMTVLDSFLK